MDISPIYICMLEAEVEILIHIIRTVRFLSDRDCHPLRFELD